VQPFLKTHVEVTCIPWKLKVLTFRQCLQIEVRPHIVRNRHDKGPNVVKVALIAAFAAVIKVKLDHVTIVAAEERRTQ
jgi:hypothetical protein